MGDGDKNTDVPNSVKKKVPEMRSPIHLDTLVAKKLTLTPLKWQSWTCSGRNLQFLNTGQTVYLICNWGSKKPNVSGGPLNGNYLLAQIHFHWGENESTGSEHSMDGRRYSMEMHVVLYKESFKHPEYASSKADGIAIIVYFFQKQDTCNPKLKSLVKYLPYIRNPNSCVDIRDSVLGCIPQFKEDYLFYWGLLSSKSNGQMWIICTQPLGISIKQLSAFRELKDSIFKNIAKNYTEPNPLLQQKLYVATTSVSLNNQIVNPESSTPTSSNTQESLISHDNETGTRFCLNFPKPQPQDMVLKKQATLRNQIREMERRSKQLLKSERKNEKEWTNRIERFLHDKSNRKRRPKNNHITAEYFAKWNLRSMLFREVNSEEPHSGEVKEFVRPENSLPNLVDSGYTVIVKKMMNKASQTEAQAFESVNKVRPKKPIIETTEMASSYIIITSQNPDKRNFIRDHKLKGKSKLKRGGGVDSLNPIHQETVQTTSPRIHDGTFLKTIMHPRKVYQESSEESQVPEEQHKSSIQISAQKVTVLNLMKHQQTSISEKDYNLHDTWLRLNKSEPDSVIQKEFDIEQSI